MSKVVWTPISGLSAGGSMEYNATSGDWIVNEMPTREMPNRQMLHQPNPPRVVVHAAKYRIHKRQMCHWNSWHG